MVNIAKDSSVKGLVRNWILTSLRLFFVPINLLIQFKLFWNLLNRIYERAAWRLVNVVVKFIKIPNTDNDWSIRLINGCSVKTKILENNNKTWQFSLAYRWHAPALNALEHTLNQYYSPTTQYLDIGANLGMRSLLFLSTGRPTIMIEPNPEANQLNCSRANLNKFQNFEIVEAGVSSGKGESDFYIDQSSFLSSFEKSLIPQEALDYVTKVATITLDEIILSRGIESEFFAKIDVEGHEWEVIKGGMASIKRLSPSLIVEINKKGVHIENIFNFFFELGYSLFAIARIPKRKRFLVEINPAQNLPMFPSNDFLFVRNPELLAILRSYFLLHQSE